MTEKEIIGQKDRQCLRKLEDRQNRFKEREREREGERERASCFSMFHTSWDEGFSHCLSS